MVHWFICQQCKIEFSYITTPNRLAERCPRCGSTNIKQFKPIMEYDFKLQRKSKKNI